jgi:protein SCO1/2
MLLRIGLLAWAFLSWPAGNSAATRTNVPDVALLDQDGRPVHFYRDLVQGRVVAIDFVFTTCKTICSLLGANFAQVEKLVDPRLASRVRLISISVDPANDTPARLKEFRARFHGSPAWRLVTGNKNDVETLLKGLGEYTADLTAHTGEVLIGNGDGQWVRANGLGSPAKIADLLTRAANSTTLAGH